MPLSPSPRGPHRGTYVSCLLRDRRAERRDDVGPARHSDRAPDDATAGIEDEDGRGTHDVEPPDETQVRLGVDVDVADAVDHPRHVGEHATGGTARLAEGG